MDAIGLIVTALVAGLTSGVTESTTNAIKDTYTALKTRLWSKTEKNESAQTALIELEKKPESEGRQEVLKEELTGIGVENDAELLALAKEMMVKVDLLGAQQGKYNITLNNAQGVVIGDNPQVQQNFGKQRKKRDT